MKIVGCANGGHDCYSAVVPSGVGALCVSPAWLVPGDEVTVDIAGVRVTRDGMVVAG